MSKRQSLILTAWLVFWLFFSPVLALAIGPPVQDALANASAQNQSLFQYLIAFLTGRETEIYGALLFFGVIGMIGNYTKRWLTGEIAGSLFDYMFRQHPRATMLAACSIAAELFGEVGLGLFTSASGEFVGWSMVIATALKSGYIFDSMANKGTKGNGDVATTNPGVKP